MARTRTNEIPDAPRPGSQTTPSDMSTAGYQRFGEIPDGPRPGNMSTPMQLVAIGFGRRINEVPGGPLPS